MNIRPSGFSVLPDVVKNLIIINVLFFLAKITLLNVYHYNLDNLLGLHLPTSEKFKPFQFITYMFMHGDWVHIFFNMFAVWMFGSALENVWGPKRFLIYYLITGLGAALIHYVIVYIQMMPSLNAIDTYLADPSLESLKDYLYSPDFKIPSEEAQIHYQEFIKSIQLYNTQNPEELRQVILKSNEFMSTFKEDLLNAPNVVGASGALFGLLLAFGMLFPNQIIYIYFAIPLKAKYFVMIYGALELYSGYANNPGDNVAHFAHLGGMLFGFLLIKYWQYKHKF